MNDDTEIDWIADLRECDTLWSVVNGIWLAGRASMDGDVPASAPEYRKAALARIKELAIVCNEDGDT